VALEDWNWKLARDAQNYSWDCAAASTAWCLRAIGRDYSEEDVIAGLGPERISPQWGLLDASGAGLASWLQEIGVNAENNAQASWSDVLDAAGFQPMVVGGRYWSHWSAVRASTENFPEVPAELLFLMNPADGWMGIGQSMSYEQFNSLGSFSAVWFASW
jgi:hypothetical protein